MYLLYVVSKGDSDCVQKKLKLFSKIYTLFSSLQSAFKFNVFSDLYIFSMLTLTYRMY